MAPVVAAYQALRGVSFLVAITFVAEVGDVRRFATPQQLMAFLGLVPSERTTGDTVRRGSITKTGNHRARRVLIEGAWTYRFPARVGETLRSRLKDLPLSIRSIAWKAQVRLCARYRRLIANGKKTPVATTAIARELGLRLIRGAKLRWLRERQQPPWPNFGDSGARRINWNDWSSSIGTGGHHHVVSALDSKFRSQRQRGKEAPPHALVLTTGSRSRIRTSGLYNGRGRSAGGAPPRASAIWSLIQALASAVIVGALPGWGRSSSAAIGPSTAARSTQR